MMPTDITYDMMRRTVDNLRFVEEHQQPDGPYEVTQLINSFLGALAHPWERYRSDLNEMSLSEAVERGWPDIQKDRLTDSDPKNLGDLLRLIRNSFAHGNIHFMANPDMNIHSVTFWNKNRKGQRTWGAALTVDELRQFLDCFVALAEELGRRPQ